MPVETDSDEWKNAESGPRIELLVVDFLRKNPDKAFRIREIADEIMGTDWEEVEETQRLKDEMGWEEYYEEYGEEDRSSNLSEFRPTDRLLIVIRDLEANGIVEVRFVDSTAFEDAYTPELEELPAYSYAGPVEEDD